MIKVKFSFKDCSPCAFRPQCFHSTRRSGRRALTPRPKEQFASLQVAREREETVDYIRQEAESRLLEKNESRMAAEAEAYVAIMNWDLLRPSDFADSDWDLSILSQGAFLNRIAAEGPHKLRRRIVVTLDALYGFLVTAGSSLRGRTPM